MNILYIIHRYLHIRRALPEEKSKI